MNATLRRGIAAALGAAIMFAGASTVGATNAHAAPRIVEQPALCSPLPTRCTGTDHIPSFRITGTARVTTVWGPR